MRHDIANIRYSYQYDDMINSFFSAPLSFFKMKQKHNLTFSNFQFSAWHTKNKNTLNLDPVLETEQLINGNIIVDDV